MLRSIFAGLVALLCSIASIAIGAAQAHAAEGMLGQVQAGAHVGTLGAGVNVGLDISEQFAARALFSTWELDYEETESDNEYQGDLDLQTIGLVTDWHPFAGGFRVTGGMFLNNNEVSATASGQEVDIGDKTYEDGQIDMLLDFERIAPYFGAGWTSGPIGDPGFSFSADAGLLYQRAPRLSGSGKIGDACSFSISRGGDATVLECDDAAGLRADLEREHMDLADDLKDFEWYPVLSIGVSYRF